MPDPIAYFLISGIICAFVALWFTGWFFRGANNPQSRWLWFAIIWVVMMILAYIPSR